AVRTSVAPSLAPVMSSPAPRRFRAPRVPRFGDLPAMSVLSARLRLGSQEPHPLTVGRCCYVRQRTSPVARANGSCRADEALILEDLHARVRQRQQLTAKVDAVMRAQRRAWH